LNLVECVIEGSYSKLARLVSNGADLDKQDDQGHTALIFATSVNKIAFVELLIDKGADLNLETIGGVTALEWSLINKNNEISVLLIGAGAKLGSRFK